MSKNLSPDLLKSHQSPLWWLGIPDPQTWRATLLLCYHCARSDVNFKYRNVSRKKIEISDDDGAVS